MATTFGDPVLTSAPTHLFPSPPRMARAAVDEIVCLGITRRRAETLVAVAEAMSSGRLLLEPGRSVEKTLAQLRSLPGIGEWTAQHIATPALSPPDAFPHADLGIGNAPGETNPKRILKIAEKWRRWRVRGHTSG